MATSSTCPNVCNSVGLPAWKASTMTMAAIAATAASSCATRPRFSASEYSATAGAMTAVAPAEGAM